MINQEDNCRICIVYLVLLNQFLIDLKLLNLIVRKILYIHMLSQKSSILGHKMMAKDALWGEMEENSKEDKKIANVAEKKDASERIIVARRNSDEEMESDDDEDDVDDKIKAMDKTTEVEEEGNVRASIIRTAVRSEGFFRHQQVKRLS